MEKMVEKPGENPGETTMSLEAPTEVDKLKEENAQLKTQLNAVTNMFRFTLGIAIQARPELKQLQSMVASLYK